MSSPPLAIESTPAPALVASRPRLEWVDVLRGLGIVLVVFGHAVPAAHAAYLFHMPLFFLLSGYLTKVSVERDVPKHVLRKTSQLIVPYLCFLIGLRALGLLKGLIHKSPNSPPFVEDVWASVFGGAMLRGPYSVFWFVTCLFFVQLIFAALGPVMKRTTAVIALIAASYGMGLLDGRLQTPWPLAANVVPMAMFYFLIGHLVSRISLSGLRGATVVLLPAALLIAATFPLPSLQLDMKYSRYGLVGLTPMCAIGLSMGLAVLAMLLTKIKSVSAGTSALGRASLVIMFMHQTVQLALGDPDVRPLWRSVLAAILAIAISYGFYVFFTKFELSRVLLLGERPKKPAEPIDAANSQPTLVRPDVIG